MSAVRASFANSALHQGDIYKSVCIKRYPETNCHTWNQTTASELTSQLRSRPKSVLAKAIHDDTSPSVLTRYESVFRCCYLSFTFLQVYFYFFYFFYLLKCHFWKQIVPNLLKGKKKQKPKKKKTISQRCFWVKENIQMIVLKMDPFSCTSVTNNNKYCKVAHVKLAYRMRHTQR